MFLGQHLHSLDAKGRLILPARYREELASACITSQIDGCLAVWPEAAFQTMAGRMREKFEGDGIERDTARVFFSGAELAAPDSQGRIAIPVHLRTFAQLDKEVVVTGAFDHVEIWDAATWELHKRSGEAALAGGTSTSTSTGTSNGDKER